MDKGLDDTRRHNSIGRAFLTRGAVNVFAGYSSIQPCLLVDHLTTMFRYAALLNNRRNNKG